MPLTCGGWVPVSRRTGRRYSAGRGKNWARGLRLEEGHPLWKGDEAKPNAGRARARRWYSLEGMTCERCGEKPAVERHHIDEDTTNNERENIALLCKRCHNDVHGRVEMMIAASARVRGAATHCKHGHEYTPENTYISKDGSRSCLICRKRSHDVWHAKKRAEREAAR